ncbi:MAG: hypothetical protein ACE5OP_11490 [Candidatus Glassbacteria bacterium]
MKRKKGKRPKKVERSQTATGSEKFAGFREENLDKLVPFFFVILTIILFRKFIFSDEMLFGTDTIAAGVFFRSFYAYVVRTYHTLPLWDPYILGGLPFVDAMHGDTFYPTTILKFFIPIFRALGYKLIIHIFFAGITSYHCAKSFGISRLSSMFVALSYMFSANLVSLVYGGHGGKIYVITIFPLSMYLLNRGFDSRKTFHFILFGASIGLMVLTAHIQMAYFALWGIGLYFLYRLYGIRGEGRKALSKITTRFILSLGLGISLSALQLIPPYIYLNRYSPRAEGGRGYEFATSWSLHMEEVASLVFPDFSGIDTGSEGTYWGRNFFKINSEYSGILPVLFAVLAVCLHRRGNLFWLMISLLAIIYGLGANTPVFKLFYAALPGVKVFRAPSLITFIFTFSVVLMAGMGLDAIREASEAERVAKTIRVLLVTLSALWVFILFVSISPEKFFAIWLKIFYPNITDERFAILSKTRSGIIAGMWIIGTIALLAVASLYMARKDWAGNFPLIIFIISLCTVGDLWRIDSRFIQVVSPDRYFSRDKVVDFLKMQQGKFRVFPIPGTYPQNFLAYHRIEEITGHHGNELKRYREFTGEDNLSQPRFLNLLNVKYLLTRSQFRHPLFKKVFSSGGITVFKNLESLPRAFVVHCYEVQEKESVLSRLRDESFDYRNCIILEKKPDVEPEISGKTTGNGEWARLEYESPNSFYLECNLEEPGFVFMSENYYPSWKAYEGDVEIQILRCDYIFRAVYLAQGEHRIHFKFESTPLKVGFLITLLSTTIIAAAVVFELVSRRKNK